MFVGNTSWAWLMEKMPSAVPCQRTFQRWEKHAWASPGPRSRHKRYPVSWPLGGRGLEQLAGPSKDDGARTIIVLGGSYKVKSAMTA